MPPNTSAIRRWRIQFRCRGSRHESAVTQLTLGGITYRMKITDGGLDDPRVQKLLAHHSNSARAETAPGSAHALDPSGLNHQTFIFGLHGMEKLSLGFVH